LRYGCAFAGYPGHRGSPSNMIEETARHAGHADILREHIDGATDL
jgi:hypothetical protein